MNHIKRYVISALLIFFLLLSVVSCGKKNDDAKQIPTAIHVDNTVKDPASDPVVVPDAPAALPAVAAESEPVSTQSDAQSATPEAALPVAEAAVVPEVPAPVAPAPKVEEAPAASVPASGNPTETLSTGIGEANPAPVKEEAPLASAKVVTPSDAAASAAVSAPESAKPSAEIPVVSAGSVPAVQSDVTVVTDDYDFLAGDSVVVSTVSREKTEVVSPAGGDNLSSEAYDELPAPTNTRQSSGGFSLFGGRASSHGNEAPSTDSPAPLTETETQSAATNAEASIPEPAHTEPETAETLSSGANVDQAKVDEMLAKVPEATLKPKAPEPVVLPEVAAVNESDTAARLAALKAQLQTPVRVEGNVVDKRTFGIQFGFGLQLAKLDYHDFTGTGLSFSAPISFNVPIKNDMTISAYVKPSYLHITDRIDGSAEMEDSFILAAGVGFGIKHKKALQVRLNLGVDLFNEGTNIGEKDPNVMLHMELLPSFRLGLSNLWLTVPFEGAFSFEDAHHNSLFATGLYITYRSGEGTKK